MHWINQSLNRKFTLGTAIGLLMSSLIFLVLFIGMYRGELAHERTETVTQVNRLLRASLENAMLKRDLDGLRYIVNRLGTQPGITSVAIANPKGEIRFASDPALLGEHRAEAVGARSTSTRFLQDSGGQELLRSVNPVNNREPCTQCHGPVTLNPVNGILFVDYDAAPIRSHALFTTLLLMGSGALIVLINIIGGWWFIRRFVLSPVDRLTQASRALTQGELSTRLHMPGEDELAQLGDTFDRMAASLQEQMRKLEEKEAFLQGLVDAIPDGVRIIDQNYRVILTNRAYLQQLDIPGIEPGTPCYSSSHGHAEPCAPTLITCPLHEIGKTGKPLKVLHQHQKTNGDVLEVEVYAAPMEAVREGERQTLVVESVRDLAEQVQFSHEHKLSELGKLASGVAHEIYNPLASVRIALHETERVLQMEQSDPEELKEYLKLVDKEVDKCIDVTERLLKLSTAPSPTPELVTINDVVFETLSLLRWEAEQCHVRLKGEPADDTPRTVATDSELRMVMLNLIQNAFHAMPEGGELEITIERRDGMVEIGFTDNGVGIPADTMPHIFDPFFTRRANDSSGTGLGLTICKTIVENYGGTLSVSSQPGAGSRFLVRLPDADSHEEGA